MFSCDFFSIFLRCGAPSGSPKVRGLGPWPPWPPLKPPLVLIIPSRFRIAIIAIIHSEYIKLIVVILADPSPTVMKNIKSFWYYFAVIVTDCGHTYYFKAFEEYVTEKECK